MKSLWNKIGCEKKDFITILENSVWYNRKQIPKYSVLEVILENQITFSDKDHMAHNIIKHSAALASKIE